MHAGRLIPLGVATIISLGRIASANAEDPRSASDAATQPLRPAVLILPVWDAPERRQPSGRVEVVEPGGHRRLAGVSGRMLHRAAERPPTEWRGVFGSEYVSVHSFAPSPLLPNFRYHVYMNLSDPSAVRNWRELQRARRREARQAQAEWQSLRDWDRRKQQLLSAHKDTVQEGLAELRAGEYRYAVIALTRAAELNHGDPACRIYLTLARIAVGHDTEAASALRAALELQPRLAPVQLSLEDYYPRTEDLAVYTAGLGRRLAAGTDASPDEYLLLGFLEFQLGRLDEAHAAFLRARRGSERDDLVQTFLTITKPVTAGP